MSSSQWSKTLQQRRVVFGSAFPFKQGLPLSITLLIEPFLQSGINKALLRVIGMGNLCKDIVPDPIDSH